MSAQEDLETGRALEDYADKRKKTRILITQILKLGGSIGKILRQAAEETFAPVPKEQEQKE